MSTIQTRPFDMANYLHNEAEITEYLRQVLEDGDPAELAAALGDIAHARTMKCPVCGAAELIHDTRDMAYTYKVDLLPVMNNGDSLYRTAMPDRISLR